MIVDTSAIIAILRCEEDADQLAEILANRDGPKRISAANWLEAAMVIDAERSPIASRQFDKLIHIAGIEIEAVTAEQVHIAREAYRDFGKGSGHSAKLNYGDCFAYALAKLTGEPLLFKGEDFIKTDVAVQR